MRIVGVILLCALAAGGGSSFGAGLVALALGIIGGSAAMGGSVAFTLILFTAIFALPVGLLVSVVAVPILEALAQRGYPRRFRAAALVFYFVAACVLFALTAMLHGEAAWPFLLFAAPGAAAAAGTYLSLRSRQPAAALTT